MGRCTTCHRPRKGHVGPLGSKCSQLPLDIPNLGTSSDDTDHEDSVTSEEDSTGGRRGRNRNLRDDGHVSEAERVDSPRREGKTSGATTDPNVMSSLAEILRQMSLLSADVAGVKDDNRDLASSHTLMQSRIETLSSSRGSSNATDILAALTAISSPASQDQPVSLFTGARISKKTHAAAKAREFVNLADFLPNYEPCSTMVSSLDESSGQLVFKSKAAKRTIDNVLMWMQSWLGYEALLMECDSSIYQTCTNYRLFIQRTEAVHSWSAVMAYDHRLRVKLSMSKSLQFDVLDNDIHMSCFSSATIRANPKACYRCHSIDHMVKDCFLLEEGSSAKTSQPSRTGKRSNNNNPFYSQVSSAIPTSGVYNPAGQVCRDFNLGRCVRSPCTRRHVCSGCGGPEPIYRCARCSPNSLAHSYSPQQGGVGSASVPPPR